MTIDKYLSKNILITGGTQGLGLSLAKKLITDGANVIVCGRTDEDLQKTKLLLDAINIHKKQILVFKADISKFEEVQKLHSYIQSKIGNINALVNNAGIIGPIHKFLDVQLKDWVRTVEVNLLGSIFTIKEFLPEMLSQKKGKIVQISGGGATSEISGMSSYASSKTAIVRFMETLACEYQNSGVDFNSVSPGMLKTRMLFQMSKAKPDNLGQELHSKTIKALKEPQDSMEEACRLIAFLCSEKSNGISGKLISAVWDRWEEWPNHLDELTKSDIYTLRRITGRERSSDWGDK